MYELYLAHHGILGMKWGVRRYQNPDGTLTAAGRLRYTKSGDGSYRKLSRSERKEVAQKNQEKLSRLEAAKAARAEKTRLKKERQEIIKSGSAVAINNRFSEMSNSEIRDAIDRIKLKQTMDDLENREAELIAKGKTKADRLMEKVDKTTNNVEKGIKAYNVMAKINNAFNVGLRLPTIDGTWAGDRKKKEDKERREELEKKKREKEEKEIDKLVRTGSELEILKNRDKMSQKRWLEYQTRLNVEDKLYKQLADKKIGSLNSEIKKHTSDETTSGLVSARQNIVNMWKNTNLSKESFNEIKDQFTYAEQEEIRKARGWVY